MSNTSWRPLPGNKQRFTGFNPLQEMRNTSAGDALHGSNFNGLGGYPDRGGLAAAVLSAEVAVDFSTKNTVCREPDEVLDVRELSIPVGFDQRVARFGGGVIIERYPFAEIIPVEDTK